MKRRLLRNLRIKLELTAALLVAAAYSARHPIGAWPRIRAAVLAWFRWGTHRTPAPFWVYVRRNLTCLRCPIYYRPLGTCGSPLDKDLHGLGCWCKCLVKNGDIYADCWLRENGVDLGWSDALRRFATQPERLANAPRNPAGGGCSKCGNRNS